MKNIILLSLFSFITSVCLASSSNPDFISLKELREGSPRVTALLKKEAEELMRTTAAQQKKDDALIEQILAGKSGLIIFLSPAGQQRFTAMLAKEQTRRDQKAKNGCTIS